MAVCEICSLYIAQQKKETHICSQCGSVIDKSCWWCKRGDTALKTDYDLLHFTPGYCPICGKKLC